MRLLALDTSAEACSAALYQDGALTQCLEPEPRRHGELILPMLQGLLAQAGLGLGALDAVAFGCGPGSFTGVRIAVAVVQGIAFGAGLPTVPISTLAALAQGEFRRSGRRRLLAALDARMGEVYWGAFEVGDSVLVRPCGPEVVSAPAAVPVPSGGGWYGVGSGWGAWRDPLADRVGAGLLGVVPAGVCEAQDIALLAVAEVTAGRLVAPELARPVYLRDRVTQSQATGDRVAGDRVGRQGGGPQAPGLP